MSVHIFIPLILMLATGGFFAGSVITIAWNRITAWRLMPDEQFIYDFAETIHIADKLQPALLLFTLTATLWLGFNSNGAAQVMAFVSTIGLGIILILSVLILVPLQNRLINAYRSKDTVTAKQLRDMRQMWLNGHIGRSIFSAIILLFLIATAFVVMLS